MALKDALKFVDHKLADIFHAKTTDPLKARTKAIAGLKRTHEQFASKEAIKGRKWFAHRNGIVLFKPPFMTEEHMVPAEHFPTYLGHIQNAVESGELDEHLSGATKAKRTATVRTPNPKKAWTPERRAAQLATLAAKKKANQKK